MRIQSVIRRLKSAHPGLPRIARDLGHELPRKRLVVLSQLRTALAGPRPPTLSEFDSGYRRALADVVAAYEAAIKPELDHNAVIRAIKQRKHWAKTIRLLARRPRTPGDIAKALTISLAVASRLLADLRGAGLVEHCVSDSGGDGRSRPQQLSALGSKCTNARTL